MIRQIHSRLLIGKFPGKERRNGKEAGRSIGPASQLPGLAFMNKLIGIVLIILGCLLFVQGLNRKDSLVGKASDAGTSIANSVDGGSRTPKHVMYMVGGGALVVIGAALAFKSSSTV